MVACNDLNQNEYKVIIILSRENLYFLFIKESTTSIYNYRANSWLPFKGLIKGSWYKWFRSSVCKCVNNSCLFLGSSLWTLRSIAKLVYYELREAIQGGPQILVGKGGLKIFARRVVPNFSR